MFDKSKIERFTKLLQGYEPDQQLTLFYNEVLKQIDIAEMYVSELEINNMELMLHNGERHVTEIQWMEYCAMKSQYQVRTQLRDIEKQFKDKINAAN